MSDKKLTCKDCGANFVFTESEQEFYREKGFTNEPTRCPDCRAARKQSRGQDDRRGGYQTNQRSSDRVMYSAICAGCGKQTQVPFKPSGDRPVYCRDCFQGRR